MLSVSVGAGSSLMLPAGVGRMAEDSRSGLSNNRFEGSFADNFDLNQLVSLALMVNRCTRISQ